MKGRQIAGTPLVYLGQAPTGAAIPQQLLHPAPGRKHLLLSDERQNTYVYDAPRTATRKQVESWTATAFPYGCSVAVVHSSITQGRRK